MNPARLSHGGRFTTTFHTTAHTRAPECAHNFLSICAKYQSVVMSFVQTSLTDVANSSYIFVADIYNLPSPTAQIQQRYWKAVGCGACSRFRPAPSATVIH